SRLAAGTVPGAAWAVQQEQDGRCVSLPDSIYLFSYTAIAAYRPIQMELNGTNIQLCNVRAN
ncbi:MAG: hypothetical protein WC810_19760, partial [Janthinobacterium sp.]